MEFFLASFLGASAVAAVYVVAVHTRRCAVGVRPFFLGAYDSLLLLFLIVLVALAASALSGAFSGFEGVAAKIYIPTVIVQVLSVVLSALFARSAGLPMSVRPTAFALKTGLLYFFPTLAVLACGASVAIFYRLVSGTDIGRQEVVSMFMEIEGVPLKLLASFSIVVLAPLTEEIFFRGILYPVFKGWFSSAFGTEAALRTEFGGKEICVCSRTAASVAAAVAVSALFSLIHASAYAAVPIFFMGLILALCYERANSLAAPIATHALFNIANIAMISFA